MKKRGIWLGIGVCLVLVAGLAVQRWSTATAQPLPQVAVVFLSGSYTVGESDGSVTITVTLSQASSSTVTVDYATSDGTAISTPATSADYHPASGTITFPPYSTSQTFTVIIFPDVCCEPTEAFTVTLSNPQGASIGIPDTTTVNILNDDTCP